MDAVAAQVDALTVDAIRGARPGAIGDAPDHPGAIVAKPLDGVVMTTTPSSSPLSVSIDGAGFFVLEHAGRRCYTRLGDFRFDEHGTLVDRGGRAVLGLARSQSGRTGSLVPIRRNAAESASIDANGVVTVNGTRGAEPIGRIALAVFPASEHRGRLDDSTLRSITESGERRTVPAGTPNVGRLTAHVLENAFVDVAGDLEGMWRAQRRGETQAAEAGAEDACERAAMGLVR